MKKSTLIALISGLALAWIPFVHVLFNGNTALLYRDLTNVYLPIKALWMKAFLELGRVPHWNPFHASGIPFLSDPVNGAFDPANFLFLLAPHDPARGMIYFLVLRHLVLFTGGFLLARALRARLAVAWMAGFGLAWSGFAMSADNLPHILAGQCAVPFFAYFLLRSRRAENPAPLLFGSALSLAYPVIAGDLQFTYMMVLVSAYLCIFSRERIRWGKTLLVVYTSALLLSAPQLLPTLAHFAETTRGTGRLALTESMAWSLHPMQLVELLFPLPFGHRPDFGFYSGYRFVDSPLRNDPFIFSFYPGIFCFLFSGLYLNARFSLRRRRKVSIPLLAGIVLLLLLVLGHFSPIPLAALFAKYVPLWGAFRFPSRLVYWLIFPFWWLSVRSSEKILRLMNRRRKLGWKPVAVTYSLALIAMLAWESKSEIPHYGLLSSTLCFSLLLGALVYCSRSARKKIRSMAPLCALLASADLGLVASQLVWPQPLAFAQPGLSPIQQKVLADLEKQRETFSKGEAQRLYAFPQSFVNEEDPAEIALKNSLGGTLNREMFKTWAFFRNYTASTFRIELATRHNTPSPRHLIYNLERESPRLMNRFMDLAGVRYFVMEGDRAVYVRGSALPYVNIPSRIAGAPEGIELLARLGDDKWDPRRTMLLEGNDAKELENPSPWKVVEVKKSWDRIGIKLVAEKRLEAPSWLHVNEAFEPGWKAWQIADSRNALTSLLNVRANGWDMGIWLPGAEAPGAELNLQLVYAEPLLLPGFVLFLACLLFYLAGTIAPRGRQAFRWLLK